MASSPQPTNSGIVTDETSGERHIPESVRADGTKRKAIKIRPGYRPPEDVEVYKNRTAETFRNRGKGPVPGAEGLAESKPAQSPAISASAAKNAKRREARKKAKEEQAKDDTKSDPSTLSAAAAAEELDPEVEKEKKARNLKKKLRQAKELKEKKDGGGSLLPEQIAKVIKINELIRELEALGFDADGEPKKSGDDTASPAAAKETSGKE
ncbi:hypothetical protein QBC47DRAFT_210977 [Echria macrotheca]|uniref:WIBG Mago-binding domain-containing protein n=1 Tax=Echria macrotheca TaxID=438768 RepID=A0AAJ0F619_9PEZI|nr:hypothetical protein QBC47DRAFT_210977 [Echria macrotheca]